MKNEVRLCTNCNYFRRADSYTECHGCRARAYKQLARTTIAEAEFRRKASKITQDWAGV